MNADSDDDFEISSASRNAIKYCYRSFAKSIGIAMVVFFLLLVFVVYYTFI